MGSRPDRIRDAVGYYCVQVFRTRSAKYTPEIVTKGLTVALDRQPVFAYQVDNDSYGCTARL